MFQQFLWHLQDHLIDLVGVEDTGSDQERCVTITWIKMTDFIDYRHHFITQLSRVFIC